jgi:hypothetical protein
MNKTSILLLMCCIYLFSCGKGDTGGSTTVQAYMNLKAGSTWNYQNVNNIPPGSTATYTLTSTNKDTTVSGNSYHVFTNSANAASEYYRISGSDHYTFQSLPAELGGAKVENLYLKAGAAVGTSWSQAYNITFNGLPLVVTLTHTIAGKGLSRTVLSKAYTDVIHVSSTIAVSGIPPTALTTDIQYYYAPNVGLIENTTKIDLNYFTLVSKSDNTVSLKTSSLQ